MLHKSRACPGHILLACFSILPRNGILGFLPWLLSNHPHALFCLHDHTSATLVQNVVLDEIADHCELTNAVLANVFIFTFQHVSSHLFWLCMPVPAIPSFVTSTLLEILTKLFLVADVLGTILAPLFGLMILPFGLRVELVVPWAVPNIWRWKSGVILPLLDIWSPWLLPCSIPFFPSWPVRYSWWWFVCSPPPSLLPWVWPFIIIWPVMDTTLPTHFLPRWYSVKKDQLTIFSEKWYSCDWDHLPVDADTWEKNELRKYILKIEFPLPYGQYLIYSVSQNSP